MVITVCTTCGDIGIPEALVFCSKCQVYAQHRYCLAGPVIFVGNVTWYCEECVPNVAKPFIPDEIIPFSDSVNLENVNATQARRKLNHLSHNATQGRRNLNYLLHRVKRKKQKKRRRKKKKQEQNESQRHDIVGSVNKKKKQEQNESQRHDIVSSVNKSKLCVSNGIISLQDEERQFNENSGMDQKFGEESAVVLRDGTSDEESASVPISQLSIYDPSSIGKSNVYADAQPIIAPIWRGSFCICNQSGGTTCGLVAHLSSLACSKVQEEASLFPDVLRVELRQRSKVWPKGFQKWGPSDQNIALYFFPASERDEKNFDKLVDDVIRLDLAITAVVENAQLLIFSSTILPMQYWIKVLFMGSVQGEAIFTDGKRFGLWRGYRHHGSLDFAQPESN
ncbi:RING/FYVE/PHD zinc finger superfamily protein [Quillaja saponaria]|uniref:RING/FYVE/PHD zinc finger superfamily protein n=1 Tax=Quillaja saponaria TaxID=32244 RepID=A0AAD7Q3E5_QUISA|nr:RING/FYVE/PHD zinc finger superfamily protein [Quillaja saponaria]